MKIVIYFLATLAVVLAASKPFNIFAYSYQESHNFSHASINPVSSYHPYPSLGIIHGQETKPHSIPHQAFIRFTGFDSVWACGGVLITPKYVLTAGHCTFNAVIAEVLLGAHRIFEKEDTQQFRVAFNIRTYEDYKPGDIHNNLGLIELTNSAKINDYVKPVHLPKDNTTDYTGKTLRVSGWGQTDGPNGNLSKVLNYIEDKVISNEECQKAYPAINDSEMCMTGENGKVICDGDIGGPATVDGVLVGITIFSATNCSGGYPTGYTRTSHYLNWIRSISDY